MTRKKSISIHPLDNINYVKWVADHYRGNGVDFDDRCCRFRL